ncbi:MAG: prepilin-type N-terminal cleavage/methylation domain-containing protein [Candidatus Moraniibacteriota bacterium]|nr:MAG: prepilin-type N-terminal cleavage/methylation domain-containing protein [Candidatus Moranbacteria bacterium]
MSNLSSLPPRGFSILEVVFASALFLIIASALVMLVLQGLAVETQSQEYQSAVAYAEEGRDAVRMLRKAGFEMLGTVTDGGFASDGYGSLRLDGGANAFGIFERRMTIADISRFDGTGNDGSTKRVTVTVTWPVGSETPRTVILTDYLVYWENGY